MNILNTSEQTQITLDGSTLIHGKYSVQGQDLLITTEFDSVLLKDYFEHLPTLVSPQGSKLTPKLVSLLSAYQPNDYLGFEDPQAIGEITLTGGPITVTRAGQQIELNVGDFIYLNDLVEVGEYNVGITFKDDTALSLESGARMIIDDFVYDPDTPTEGSMNANVLGGGFSFVSGNVAKVGADAMTVTTPVLTIGVRGTQVAGRANQDGEDNEIILLPNEDGTVGQIMVSNDSGSVLLTEAFQGTTITSAVEAPSIPVIIPEDIVLKKFAKTIATNKTTLKTSKKNKQSKEAEKEKQKLEKEKEELEQEKEQLEEEAEQLEEEKAELEEKLADEDITEEEKAELEEELAAVEEKAVAVEEKVEQVVEQAEEVEQKFEKVEQQIQEIEQEFEQFFEEIKEEFGEEVVADVEQAVAEAEKVFEEKIQEEVAKEVEAEIKEEETIEDPFEEAPEEEMEKEMEQKMEEEILLLEEEPPVEEMPVEEDIFEEKMEEEVNQIEEEFAPENFEEEPMLVEDNVFEDAQKDEPKIEEEKIEEVKVEDFNQPMMNDEVFQEEFVAFFEPDANENEDTNDFNFPPIINLETNEEEDIEVIEAETDAPMLILNSAPTIDSISNVSKSENLSVGSTIATASASDADGDSITYSLTVDQTGKLSIDQNGVITLASAFEEHSSDVNYNVTVRASDGTDDAKINFVLTVTDDGTILTKAVGTGTLKTEWGDNYSKDMTMNNAWSQQDVLVFGEFNSGTRQDVIDVLEDNYGTGWSFNVTDGGNHWGRLDTYTNAELSKYMMIIDVTVDNRWGPGSDQTGDSTNFNKTITNGDNTAIKDYLSMGGVLLMHGENMHWDNGANSTLQTLIRELDSDVDQTNQIYGGGGSGGAHQRGTNGEYVDFSNASSSYSLSSISGYPPAPGKFVDSRLGDGNLIAGNVLAEWGGDALNTGYEGTFIAYLDGNYMMDSYNGSGHTTNGGTHYGQHSADLYQFMKNEAYNSSYANGRITIDEEYLPKFKTSYGGTDYVAQNNYTKVDAYHLGDNVYIGGGMDHIDFVWDDSADTAYWAFNTDMDTSADVNGIDDHYGVIGYDADGDGDLWETTDTFNLDKIKILDDSVDYLAQDPDATGDYYLKITPVTYDSNSWTVETSNTVTVTNTTDYNAYLDLSANTAFDNINYALIETESALISEVVIST